VRSKAVQPREPPFGAKFNFASRRWWRLQIW